MLSLWAGQVWGHPVMSNPPSGSCFMEKELEKGQQGYLQVFQCVNAMIEMVQDRLRRERKEQTGLEEAPSPSASAAAWRFQQRLVCPGCTGDRDHVAVRRIKEKSKRRWHQMLCCQYTQALPQLFGWSWAVLPVLFSGQNAVWLSWNSEDITALSSTNKAVSD